MAVTDTIFEGSIPALYDRYMGPMLFMPYAEDLVRRLPHVTRGAVLEIAAGTGIVTQALAKAMTEAVRIVATDLNQPMLDHAAAKAGMDRVTFRQADALSLPFADYEFDTVVCQFGAMFFPDRVAGYREARRVLRSGGQFMFSVWDAIERNPVTHVVEQALAARYPQSPPRFMSRTPHGYHNPQVIRADLAAAGFSTVSVDTVVLTQRCVSGRDAAIGICQGTPLRNEIVARDADGLQAATDAAVAALAARFGTGAIEAPMQAHVIFAIK